MIEPTARKKMLGRLADQVKKRLPHPTAMDRQGPGLARVQRKRLAKMAPPAAPKSMGVTGK